MGTPLSKKLQKLQKLETKRTKICTKCNIIKPLHEFAVQLNRRKMATSHCIKCKREYDKENKEYGRERKYRNNYNITLENMQNY